MHFVCVLCVCVCVCVCARVCVCIYLLYVFMHACVHHGIPETQTPLPYMRTSYNTSLSEAELCEEQDSTYCAMKHKEMIMARCSQITGKKRILKLIWKILKKAAFLVHFDE